MWEDLRGLMKIEPLSDLRPPCSYRGRPFSAPLGRTVDLLSDELRHLQARGAILELDLRDRDIRLDGFPRSDAKVGSPAVVLSFTSKHGPIRMATGEFDTWQDNLRAIALGMQALRAVDRYGVSKRGEQYRGYRALPPSSDPADNITTEKQARDFLDAHGGSYREAARRLHPDNPETGDEALFRAATVARDLVEPKALLVG